MNSDKVKPEKFGHSHLVYQFTVPEKKTVLTNFAEFRGKNPVPESLFNNPLLVDFAKFERTTFLKINFGSFVS